MYSNIGNDMESQLNEIKMLLSADNYIVTEMTPEDYNTRHILYNRFQKWMLENDMKSGIFRTVSGRFKNVNIMSTVSSIKSLVEQELLFAELTHNAHSHLLYIRCSDASHISISVQRTSSSTILRRKETR